eukprot:TRINITY_DN0_c1550_g1_i1.p2 TRINITY_DN0_c1550_g1~~TRINITY_DN0_c1550_g1_i1.p2  ORF type:complete len:115 (-),score=18.19 TRINITY_DN0_c1550_g1_i1:49-393(-)
MCIRDSLDGMKPKLETQQKQKHYISQMQETQVFSQEQQKMIQLSRAFGSALPQQLTIERSLLAQPRRLPGLESSMLGLEVHMNKLSSIEYEDVFRNEAPELPKYDAHTLFLKKF